MNNEITLILVIKNRLKEPTTKCVNSILSQSCLCNVIIIDYGSTEENLKWERELFSKFKFIEVKRNTEIFNKSRALNIAIKATNTPFVLSSDIDSIFSPDFIKEAIFNLRSNKKAIVLCRKIDLAEDGSEIRLHGIAYGPCIGIFTEWLKSVHGFDEKYTLWGGEDDDMYIRANHAGFNPIWLSKKVWIRHQWHSENASDKSTMLKNRKYLRLNNHPNISIIRNSNSWGEI